MAWHARLWRRFKVAPGVTLNLSKRGVSTSFGRRGAHFTVGRRGTRTSFGIPGTGLGLYNRRSWKKPPRRQRVGVGAPHMGCGGWLLLLIVIGAAVEYWYVVVPLVLLSLVVIWVFRLQQRRLARPQAGPLSLTTIPHTPTPVVQAQRESGMALSSQAAFALREQLPSMRVIELRKIAHMFGIKTTGLRKAELIAAIMSRIQTSTSDPQKPLRPREATDYTSASKPREQAEEGLSVRNDEIFRAGAPPSQVFPPRQSVPGTENRRAGWVTDPTDPMQIAYWDGGRYTVHKRWTGTEWRDL